MNLWLAAKEYTQGLYLRLVYRFGPWYFCPIGEDRFDRCEGRRCFTHRGALRMADALQRQEDTLVEGGDIWVVARWSEVPDLPREAASAAARLSAEIQRDVIFGQS